jgi:hypothetical protein
MGSGRKLNLAADKLSQTLPLSALIAKCRESVARKSDPGWQIAPNARARAEINFDAQV